MTEPEEHVRSSRFRPPLAIGGIGGSGTRLIAALAQELGYAMGPELNRSNDDLWFTVLFRRPEVVGITPGEFNRLVEIFVTVKTGSRRLSEDECWDIRTLAMADRPQLSGDNFEASAESLIAHGTTRAPEIPERWGWKEPNTHIVLPRLLGTLPELRYLHVVRNGLDMAYSKNQNQLRFWGPWLLGEDGPVTPRRSLAYWCAAHRRIREIGARFRGRFLWLDFDRFCQEPVPGFDGLCSFLGIDSSLHRSAVTGVGPPRSTGRFRRYDSRELDPSDVAYVGSLGFPTA